MKVGGVPRASISSLLGCSLSAARPGVSRSCGPDRPGSRIATRMRYDAHMPTSSAPIPRRATASDLLALDEDARAEIVGGEIVEKAAPSGEHGETQGAIVGLLWPPFRRPAGGGQPGGWWFGTEVDIEFGPHDLFRPDVAGWRRDRAPERPTGRIVTARPDWVCEILSPSTAARDQVAKLRVYHQTGVGHYWIVDPERRTLTVYRWTEEGYLAALSAQRGENVRAEPFDAIEIPVGALFGDDPE